jgi:arylsulfatase A-like enzyme/Flp pilus assembly protein TadD
MKLFGFLVAFLLTAPALAAPPDVILITVDTLRWDAPGFAGNSRAQTPVMDRLAAQGRVFTNAHAHNVVTLPSHANILTGLYPFQHGVRDNTGFRLPPTIPTMATTLAAAGYATAAVVGAFPLDSEFGLARGFDLYEDSYPKGSNTTELAFAERRGSEVVQLAQEWWKRAGAGSGAKPRFLWMHLYDPHASYDPPEPFRSRFKTNLYAGEVAAVDSYLEPFLRSFLDGKERPALIVLTADHGEALGDHGEETHGLFAYEATLKVPLVVWGAGIEPGSDARAAGHVDLLPTVLSAAGVPLPRDRRYPGGSLLAAAAASASAQRQYFEALSATLNRGWAPLRGFLEGGNRKYVSLPLAEAYDLVADPLEATNRYPRDKKEAEAVLQRLPRESEWPPRPAAMSDESLGALRSLGYLAGAAPAAKSYGLTDDPKNLVALDRKIQQFASAYSTKQLDAALRLAREIVTERPQMPLGHSHLAQVLLETGRRDEALRAMLDAKAKGAVTDGLLRQLGLTLTELGRVTEAIAILEPLATTGEVSAREAYATALCEAGRLAEARRTLESVLAEDVLEPKANELMALVALRSGDAKEARRWADQALRVNRRLPLAWNYLGVAEAQLGNSLAAVSAWQQAVDLDPRLYDALWNLGVRAAELGLRQQAVSALTAFVERAPAERYGKDIEKARGLLRGLGVGRS